MVGEKRVAAHLRVSMILEEFVQVSKSIQLERVTQQLVDQVGEVPVLLSFGPVDHAHASRV